MNPEAKASKTLQWIQNIKDSFQSKISDLALLLCLSELSKNRLFHITAKNAKHFLLFYTFFVCVIFSVILSPPHNTISETQHQTDKNRKEPSTNV